MNDRRPSYSRSTHRSHDSWSSSSSSSIPSPSALALAQQHRPHMYHHQHPQHQQHQPQHYQRHTRADSDLFLSEVDDWLAKITQHVAALEHRHRKHFSMDEHWLVRRPSRPDQEQAATDTQERRRARPMQQPQRVLRRSRDDEDEGELEGGLGVAALGFPIVDDEDDPMPVEDQVNALL